MLKERLYKGKRMNYLYKYGIIGRCKLYYKYIFFKGVLDVTTNKIRHKEFSL